MYKRICAVLLILSLAIPCFAQEISETEYLSRLNYQRNKLQLVSKKRLIDEKRSYSYTDIDTISYSWEAYTYTTSDISTQSLSRSEAKEVTDWFIIKGGLRELSDLEFLQLVGDKTTYQRYQEIDEHKASWRNLGNISIGVGILGMIGGAAFSADKAVISGSAFATAIGFLISAFNAPPAHYIQPDYAQEKIDEYNVNLKKRLNLPLDYQ